tara:strand:- start:500 stop:1249 length:750 start_codon:yes stop_codon:yes gene_type:complete
MSESVVDWENQEGQWVFHPRQGLFLDVFADKDSQEVVGVIRYEKDGCASVTVSGRRVQVGQRTFEDEERLGKLMEGMKAWVEERYDALEVLLDNIELDVALQRVKVQDGDLMMLFLSERTLRAAGPGPAASKFMAGMHASAMGIIESRGHRDVQLMVVDGRTRFEALPESDLYVAYAAPSATAGVIGGMVDGFIRQVSSDIADNIQKIRGGQHPRVLVLPAGFDLSELDEETMRIAGWRKAGVENQGDC